MQLDETVQNTVYEIEVQIKNAAGLHMRPAMQFVDVSNKFQSAISVNNGQVTVDGKSIMQISTLMATCGTTLKIRAQGADAAQAVEALRELVEVKKFGEPTPEEVEKGGL